MIDWCIEDPKSNVLDLSKESTEIVWDHQCLGVSWDTQQSCLIGGLR